MDDKNQFTLTDKDRQEISKIMKQGGSGRLISRALTLKMKDKNFSNLETAEMAEITPRTVINICGHYMESGLQSALNDDPRPGQPQKFDDRIKAQIIALICTNPPEGFDRWTLELLQEKVVECKITNEISKETIRIILHEHDLKPWQYQMWCVPKLDEEYIRRMEDILDVYEREYNPQNPVVCLDEKPVALFGDKRDPIPFSEGKPNRIDYEYERNGSINVFCAVEPLIGTYFNEVTEFKKGSDFAKFFGMIYETYKSCEKITLIMDNYSTHTKKSIIDFYGEAEGEKIWSKFEIHFTPTHASWLNQAEIAIGMYSRQCLGSTRIGDQEILIKKTASWNRIINEKGVSIKWQFTKEKAKEKFQYK